MSLTTIGVHGPSIRLPGTQPTRVFRVATLVFWLVGLGLSAPFWTSSHFPTEDGPAYLYWTSVYRDLGEQANPRAAVFERNAHWNTPNLAYFGLQYGLSGWLEPHVAQRLILMLLLLCWVGSIHLLSLSTHGHLTLGSFAALLLFHNWSLYMGFFSFLFGIPALVCGVAILARLIRPGTGPEGPSQYFLLGSLALVAYYLHLVAGMLLAGAILVAAVVHWRHSPTRARRLLATAALPILLAVWYVLGSPFGGGGMGWAVRSTIKRFLGFAFWRGFATPGAAFWVTLFIFASTCVILCVAGFRTWRKGALPVGARFVVILSCCFTAIYFIAPVSVGLGSFLNDRIHLALWAVLLPVLGVGLNKRVGASIGAAIALLLAWQVVDFSLRARRFGHQYDAIMRAAEAIPRGSTIRYVQPYEESRFENSFVAPFMDGGEIAYHCHCILVDNYWQNSPFYWVRTKPGPPRHVDFTVSIDPSPSPAGLEISRGEHLEHTSHVGTD